MSNRHLQSQGSVERANDEIKNVLVAWMADNNTQDWSNRHQIRTVPEKLGSSFENKIFTVFGTVWVRGSH
jgi:hypothetical protein